MKRQPGFFQRLQWKLTLTYTFVTVATLLIFEILLFLLIGEVAAVSLPQLEVRFLKQEASQVASYLEQTPPDHIGLSNWLRGLNNTSLNTVSVGLNFVAYDPQNNFFVVVDSKGRVLAASGKHAASFVTGTLLQTGLSHAGMASLQTALAGQTDPHVLLHAESDSMTIAAFPIVGANEKAIGAVVASTVALDQPQIVRSMFSLAFLFAVPTIILAVLTGSLFGYLTARGLTRRLKGLASVADNWSQGNFEVFAQDNSGDELGQLARHLNRMAEQLQNLLQTRQKLATLEERNRLARDLHDSVKQQVFAIAMQVGAAQAFLSRNSEKVRHHLNEAESLVQQAQQELTALIRQLRPVALEGKGLAVALRELVASWSQQTGIPATLLVEGEQELSLPLEETLFRVTQEALANVARHSHATSVQVQLTSQQDAVTLTICDNGRGFEVAKTEGKGIGLLSMQERIKTLGGQVCIESTPEKGTSIRVHYEHSSVEV